MSARAQALDAYRSLPLPDTNEEHWRFTDLRGFDPDAFGADGAANAATAEESMLDLDLAAFATVTESGIEIARAPEEIRFEPLTDAHERLAALNWLKLYGTAADKGAIVAFGIDGLHPHDISTIIDRSGVAVRAGHHCAQPLMQRLGVTATCRASFAMYNTKAEVDALAEALIKAHDFFA